MENLVIERKGKQTILKLNGDCFGQEYIDSLIELLNVEALSTQSNDAEKYSQEELIARALTSESDYQKGDFISQEELKKESLNW